MHSSPKEMATVSGGSRRSPGDLVRIAGQAGFPRQEIPRKRSHVLREDPTQRFLGDGLILMGSGVKVEGRKETGSNGPPWLHPVALAHSTPERSYEDMERERTRHAAF